MGNSSEKIEKYFKKTINSTMNNNKNSYIVRYRRAIYP